MNTLPPPTAEAARWDARLRAPDCSKADRLAFEEWRVHPANAAAWVRLQAAVALLREHRAVSALSPRLQRRTGWAWRAVAMAALMLAVIGFALWPKGSGGGQLYASPATVVRPLQLADGSLIELGPASAVEIHFAGAERRVTLLRGNARFVIIGGAKRPFVVQAADRRVTALHTTFHVALDDRHVRVSPQRGTVRVHCWHGLFPSNMTLHTGQQLDAEIGSDQAKVTYVPERV